MVKQAIVVSLIIILSFSLVAFSQQLSPGDGVKLTFYNISDDFSGEYFVQTDWNIQFPYIGSIRVKNRSFGSIRAEIVNKYRGIYRNPEIIIQPLYKINVLGEVGRPGIYYVTGVEKLSDLLALAGGETRDANLNKIYLINGNKKVDINAKEILQKGQKLNDIGLQSGDQIYVSQKSWISRNTSIVLSGGALVATLIAVFRR
jgi:polysaccharide export outer membrane protein